MSILSQLDHKKLRIFEKIILLCFDILSFLFAFHSSHYFRGKVVVFTTNDIPYLLLPLLVTLVVNYIFDLYKPDLNISGLRAPGRTLVASAVSILIIGLLVYLIGVERFVGDFFGRGIVLKTMIFFAVLASAHRFLLNKFFISIKDRRHFLVVATREEFQMLESESLKFTQREKLSFLDVNEWSELESKLRNEEYTGIIIGEGKSASDEMVKLLMYFRLGGIRIFSIYEFFENVWFKIPVLSLKDHWFVLENGFVLLHNPIGLRVKRIGDILLSLTFMILSFPVMLISALAIKLNDFGPVIYSQVRTGEKGQDFTIYKFRSMTVSAESDGAKWAQKNDSRVTKIGKIIRLTRIDELPQLWNVLKGDMSFIGPRPERPEFNSELEKKIPYYNLRHLIKPGITGWAQVLYPYGASVEDALEKLQYDFYYIKNYNLLLDFSIIIKTIRVVLFGKGR